jgi:hypothetical protein
VKKIKKFKDDLTRRDSKKIHKDSKNKKRGQLKPQEGKKHFSKYLEEE